MRYLGQMVARSDLGMRDKAEGVVSVVRLLPERATITARFVILEKELLQTRAWLRYGLAPLHHSCIGSRKNRGLLSPDEQRIS